MSPCPSAVGLSLIRKLRPGEDLATARDEIEAVVRGAIDDPDIHVAFSYPAGRDHPIGGTAMETDPASEGVAMLAEAIRAVRPDRGRIAGAPYWSEASFLDALGIPAVYFAPGDIRICHSLEERVSIEEYLDGIAALAAFVARYCGVANHGEVPEEEREKTK